MHCPAMFASMKDVLKSVSNVSSCSFNSSQALSISSECVLSAKNVNINDMRNLNMVNQPFPQEYFCLLTYLLLLTIYRT